jgi:Di- and tricarboxylate transporters
MNTDLLLVLTLLTGCVGLFALNKPRMDVVAVLAMVALPLTGVLSVQEALAGFSDPSVVLIATLFVIGDGLVRTGIAYRLGDWLMRAAGSSETRLLILLMLAVAGLGSVMSSTGVVAIFIPGSARHRQSHEGLTAAVDDAPGICRADQRHADPRGDAAQPGGQQRAASRRP